MILSQISKSNCIFNKLGIDIINIIKDFQNKIIIKYSLFLNYKSINIFSIDGKHRYRKTIIINENNYLNIAILLFNPSYDENPEISVINIIIDIFKNNKYNNIRSITFINLISVITKSTNKNIIKNNYDNNNIEYIKKLLDNINYNEIFIAVGQHLISQGLTNIFNNTYKEIMYLILEKNIKLKYFGIFVKNKNINSIYNKIPCYPSRKSNSKIKLLNLNKIIVKNYIKHIIDKL